MAEDQSLTSADLAPAKAEGKAAASAIASTIDPTAPDLLVRSAAAALKAAIIDARKAGFVVDFREGALDRIAISTTAAVAG